MVMFTVSILTGHIGLFSHFCAYSIGVFNTLIMLQRKNKG